jgi:hypothetical protein
VDLNKSGRGCLGLVLEPIRICPSYKPKFGQGAKGGASRVTSSILCTEETPSSWFGLDNPMMYAPLWAAGGMTSIYRQIGIGCEKLFRTALCDFLGLSDADVAWSY